MHETKIPFGERDGILFQTHEVENGLRCGRQVDVENFLERDFNSLEPEHKWVTDITEIATLEGKIFLRVVRVQLTIVAITPLAKDSSANSSGSVLFINRTGLLMRRKRICSTTSSGYITPECFVG
tara:strand:+ start:712 stop:1086 length:375 start_codon:yes stop_codon:yes gene_type:complete